MAFFYVAGYLIEERRRRPVITASPRGQCVEINSEFWMKGMFRWENLTSHLVRMKNSSYYIVPVGDWTHDLPHTVASNMAKVSHVLNHSATEASG